MATRVDDIPAETALLCEGCGYTLHALDLAGNCPECGRPISDSSPDLRQPPVWESSEGWRSGLAWVVTSARALFHPSQFFRTLSLPGDAKRSRRFRWTHHAIAAVVLAAAAFIHGDRFILSYERLFGAGSHGLLLMLGCLTLTTYLALAGVTMLVVRLSAWEAAYRGLRLPRMVVSRAMDYHAVHLLPPSLVGLIIIAGYAALERSDSNLADQWTMTYLYVLAGAVVLSATYLFVTYWAAMRNLMYANRADAQPAADTPPRQTVA